MYYNEFDPKAAAWLRELMKAGLIPAGYVDERSITEVQPADIVRYRTVHLFAGVGGWPLAIRLAGWPDDRPIWTASCPCPPFSAAGKKKPCPGCQGKDVVPCPRRTGFFICCGCDHAWYADERHLWPEVWRLARHCRPTEIVGEQVPSEDGRVWLAGVRGSLEILGYGVGCLDLCGPLVGSPDIRQRLWWSARRMADTQCNSGRARRFAIEPGEGAGTAAAGAHAEPGRCGLLGGLADSDGRIAGDGGLQRGGEQRQQPQDGGIARGVEHPASNGREQGRAEPERWRAASGCSPVRLGDSGSEGLPERGGDGSVQCGKMGAPEGQAAVGAGANSGLPLGFWSDYRIIRCADKKLRRIPAEVEPSFLGLDHGIPDDLGTVWLEGFPLAAEKIEGRVSLLRGFGNAIKPPLAAEFIKAYMEINRETPCPKTT